MRRGRPTRPTSSPRNSAKPSPSPYRGSTDPFAALDRGGSKSRDPVDEISNKFPTLDQFDILHEKGGKFEFEPANANSKPEDDKLSQRLTHALADDAFAKRKESAIAAAASRKPQTPASMEQTTPAEPASLKEDRVPRKQTPLYQPVPRKPAMVSTGTMTSPSETPDLAERKPASKPAFRFPTILDQEQRQQSPNRSWAAEAEPTQPPSPRPALPPRVSTDRLNEPAASSPKISIDMARSPHLDVGDPLMRSKSANAKARPVSVIDSIKYELPRESESARSSLELSRNPYEGVLSQVRSETDRDIDRANITSDIDYLRAKEEEEISRKRDKRGSGSFKHSKRTSLSTLSLSGTKTLFASRFGDAFRRFEAGNESKPQSPAPEDSPKQSLTVTASEVVEPTDEGTYVDDDDDDDNEGDDISPEMRRELERRRLSQEEKRVANAAVEYRRRVAEKGEGGSRSVTDGSSRSNAIQNKVQTLMEENSKPMPQKTASGYGRFTKESKPPPALQAKPSELRSTELPERPGSGYASSRNPGPVYCAYTGGTSSIKETAGGPSGASMVSKSSTGYTAPTAAPAPAPAQRTGQRPPVAPPKPKNLRVDPAPAPSSARPDRSPIVTKTPITPSEDWESNFSRRYPSLSGLEMVETEIEVSKVTTSLRTKEV